jgi:hypothetical protein
MQPGVQVLSIRDAVFWGNAAARRGVEDREGVQRREELATGY